MQDETVCLVNRALEARLELTEFTERDAFRLINSSGDELPGITADRLGSLILVERHHREVEIESVVDALASFYGHETPIFLKERWSKDPLLLAGKQVSGAPSDGKIQILENGLTFQLNVCNSEHIGLFLDARLVRQEVRKIASGKRVLNLFSYTGGFGVAAAAGGARSTTNVDNKKSALKAANENYILNNLQADSRTFLRDDAIRFLTRTARGRGRFDLVILDPPPRFRVAGGRLFDAVGDYANLIGRCISVVDEGGMLLAGLNSKIQGTDGFESVIKEAVQASGAKAALVKRIGPGMDFPMSLDRPTARFALLKII